jgi:molecular chaperone DnaK
VVLVGGMTRMPLVQRMVTEFFGREPCRGVHPDEAVALGAAIQGAALMKPESDMLLLDVTPHSLGIMVVGGYFHRLIPQNETVPTSATHSFVTVRDNQTSVRILVLQGESDRAEENELLGEFVLTGLRKAPKGEVEIEVTFEISADGIVSVSAKDVETDKRQAIQVTAVSGLTEEEIRRMAQESADYLVGEKQGRQVQAERQSYERLVADLEALIPQVYDVVGESDFGIKAIAEARQRIIEMKHHLEQNDLNSQAAVAETLNRTVKMFRGVISKSTIS